MSISALSSYSNVYTERVQQEYTYEKRTDGTFTPPKTEDSTLPLDTPVKFSQLDMEVTDFEITSEYNSISRIAAKLSLNPEDLVDQLKAQGVLPEDFTPQDRLPNTIRAGYVLKNIKYPKTDEQKDMYNTFVFERSRARANARAEEKQKEAEKKQGEEPTLTAPHLSTLEKVIGWIVGLFEDNE